MMGRMRTEVNLIDADNCTFNRLYRKIMLSCIKQHGHIVEENGVSPSFSRAQKDLLEAYEEKILVELRSSIITESEYKKLRTYCENQATLFEAANNKLGKFIYFFTEYMERVFPRVLRNIYLLANDKLIEEINSQKRDASQVYLMVGSNRQSPQDDIFNRMLQGTTSIYAELNHLAKHLKVKLDKFTGSDLYDVTLNGETTFGKILRGIANDVVNAFDDSKVNIVYAAAHRMAYKNPDNELVLNLWDDHERILNSLKTFFNEHSDLLPTNLILKLHRYTGELLSTETIVGTGVVDHQYKNNTVLMAKMCGFAENKTKINIATRLDVAAFLQKRLTESRKKSYIDDLVLFKPNYATPIFSQELFDEECVGASVLF